MPRFTIIQTELFVVDGDDAQDAFDNLEQMDEDDEAAAYQERTVVVRDADGNEHSIDY